MHMGGRNIEGTPGSSMAMVAGLFAGRQHRAEAGGTAGQCGLGLLLIFIGRYTLGVGVDDLRQEPPRALGDFELLMTEDRGAADAVLQAHAVECAEQGRALRRRHALNVEVADQADADVEAVDLVVTSVGTLVLQRTAFVDPTAGVDDKMVADTSPPPCVFSFLSNG